MNDDHQNPSQNVTDEFHPGVKDSFTTNRELWLQLRQAALMAVDAIERSLDISPTTAQIRDKFKKQA